MLVWKTWTDENVLGRDLYFVMADRIVLEQYCGSNDFRPEFTKLEQLRAIMTEVPYMALTTTATEKSRFKVYNTLY